jgi:DNA-binding NtrC family response regulator
MNIFRKLKNMSILLVDDDEWIRDALSIYFESEDCRISVHDTAEKALAALYCQNYDIIITDYRLPGMDGIAFLEKIQKSHPSSVKIMITAYQSEGVVRRAKQAGAHDLVPKPFTSKTIVACLSSLIDCDGFDAGRDDKKERHQNVDGDVV